MISKNLLSLKVAQDSYMIRGFKGYSTAFKKASSVGNTLDPKK